MVKKNFFGENKFLLFSFLIFTGTSCVNKSDRVQAQEYMQTVFFCFENNKLDTNVFSSKYFPPQQIAIYLNDLKNKCAFSKEKGQFINDYVINENGDEKYYFLYDFYLNCDSLRIITGIRRNPEEKLELFTIGFEPMETDNKMIINSENRLYDPKTNSYRKLGSVPK